ncbi:response regulator [Treponema sp.]|uniref:response regulator n=1 Tax=Treponema sp. TaxID=166 RepID=UPI0025E76322|nr:response regulator [Treponema sp.]MCR5217588.1 response regulator [Treponema sp.]
MAKSKENGAVVFSALEVANICGVVNQTAINWIKSSYLKAFKTPGGQFRVYPEDLLQFMKGRNMRIPAKLQEICHIKVKTVLIVDDDKAFNDVAAKYIGSHLEGIDIQQAFDGFEAGSLMQKYKPGIVLLDLDLPGINGLNLLKRIRESPDFGSPKVIIITAMEDTEMEKQCRSYGVSYLFKKPVTLPEICGVLKGF